MEALPKRTPQAPAASFEVGHVLPEGPTVAPDHFLPPNAGDVVLLGGPSEIAHQSLAQHGKDIKLGRQIFALATEEDEEERGVPVTFKRREEVTPEYKSLLRDASYEVHKNKHLAQAAETNAVTGLPNRRAFDNMLKNTVEQAEGGGDNDIAVAILDLDGFKAVNDRKGHGFGDEVLREFGMELQATVRESDVVMHFGGDEFAVVMPEYVRDGHERLPKDELSKRMTERFRMAAEKVTQKLGAKVGASVGIGLYEKGDTPQTLSNKADVLMYKDKKSRKAEQNPNHRVHRLPINREPHTPRIRLRDRFHRRNSGQDVKLG